MSVRVENVGQRGHRRHVRRFLGERRTFLLLQRTDRVILGRVPYRVIAREVLLRTLQCVIAAILLFGTLQRVITRIRLSRTLQCVIAAILLFGTLQCVIAAILLFGTLQCVITRILLRTLHHRILSLRRHRHLSALRLLLARRIFPVCLRRRSMDDRRHVLVAHRRRGRHQVHPDGGLQRNRQRRKRIEVAHDRTVEMKNRVGRKRRRLRVQRRRGRGNCDDRTKDGRLLGENGSLADGRLR